MTWDANIYFNDRTGVGLQKQFSCLIYLFLGNQFANFSSDTKFSLLFPQCVFGFSNMMGMSIRQSCGR